MNTKQTLLCALSLAVGTLCAAEDVVITLADPSGGHPVPETLWGVFFEDINWGADGGLNPELLANGGFDWGQADHELWNCTDDGWEGDFRDGGMARLSFQYNAPVHPNTAKHLRIESFGTGKAGVRNRGYDGIFLKEGEEYRLSLDWRELEKDGLDYADAPWQEFEWKFSLKEGQGVIGVDDGRRFRFEAKKDDSATDGRWTFSLLIEGRRCVEFDNVSLQPIGPNLVRAGLRRDLVDRLAALKPAFVRFPGGCIVEEGDFQHWYDWRRTVGPKVRRECILNRWARPGQPYWETFGVGYYEYFRLCEAIGAEPLPICLAGLTCQYQRPTQFAAVEDADYFAQVVLDLIEFANGAPDTPWGKVRAEMGHPAPFGLKMVGIGNENWGRGFLDRYEVIRRIVSEKHPEIRLVGSAGPQPDGRDFDLAWRWHTADKAFAVDEHYYRPPEWFLKAARRYDGYAREGKPKVYAGEYACHHKVGKEKPNNLWSALCEAAAMTGFERNSDVVAMASYAPLFARYGHNQWVPNLIWFDGTRTVVTPNYYVQQLFSLNRPTRTIPATDTLAADDATFFHCAGLDEATGETVVKLVNAGEAHRTVKINLQGRARLIALVSDVEGDRFAVNTPEAERVKPAETQIDFGGELTLPPFSLAVLRVR